jgi:hypothetical protein
MSDIQFRSETAWDCQGQRIYTQIVEGCLVLKHLHTVETNTDGRETEEFMERVEYHSNRDDKSNALGEDYTGAQRWSSNWTTLRAWR